MKHEHGIGHCANDADIVRDQDNRRAKELPDITLPLEERRIGGLGILMVIKKMDSVAYEYTDGENILTVVKKVKRLEDEKVK